MVTPTQELFKDYVNTPAYQMISKSQSFQNYVHSYSAYTPQKILQTRKSLGVPKQTGRGRKKEPCDTAKRLTAMKLKQSRGDTATKLEVDRLVQKNVLLTANANTSVWTKPSFPTSYNSKARRRLVIDESSSSCEREEGSMDTTGTVISEAKPEEIVQQVDVNSWKAATTTLDLSIAYASSQETAQDDTPPYKQTEWTNASRKDNQLRGSLMGLDSSPTLQYNFRRQRAPVPTPATRFP
ncbi:expressed unknown protein [Seminavis robusta]|uniref:Uncharacterized protein n=1 Tax=Seminavis robusta TaxID=568900 RepID=A0A9N8ELB4_9STRA|nr:expressed unknown protein [Seminavis robusta]|eukprot:Sro1302_g260930.1 n/a (239) ;mRNA; r:25912-26628